MMMMTEERRTPLPLPQVPTVEQRLRWNASSAATASANLRDFVAMAEGNARDGMVELASMWWAAADTQATLVELHANCVEHLLRIIVEEQSLAQRMLLEHVRGLAECARVHLRRSRPW